MSRLNTFAIHLKQKRTELKVTVSELSVLSGVKEDIIESIENGQGCSFAVYGKLLTILGMEPLYE